MTATVRDLLRRRPPDARHCAPATAILVALLDGPTPLPGLLDAAREVGCRHVGHGTFLGALTRLEDAGLVERLVDQPSTWRLAHGRPTDAAA